jgi:phospholipid/cholesterol/gamma-HCH transport system ATP-binding protein
MNVKIEIIDLKKSFFGRTVFSAVNLKIMEGEIFSIIGKSGSGKSVILKHLIGLLKPDSGEIFIDGLRYTGSSESDSSKVINKIGVLFQGAALFDSMNIYNNVAFGLRRIKMPEPEIKAVVSEMLENVGLRDVEEKYPHELSGGMQKRAGLARSLALRPEIMLYDEPTTGVDPIVASAIDNLIVKTRDSFGVTSVVVTHDMNSASKISDRIAMLSEGSIIFTGTPDEMKNTDNSYIRQFVEGKANGPDMAVE